MLNKYIPGLGKLLNERFKEVSLSFQSFLVVNDINDILQIKRLNLYKLTI